MRAGDILAKAKELIEGERADTHGDALECHKKIATLWNAYLSIRRFPSDPLGPADVANMMALLKTAREQIGAHNPDDAIDKAAYGAFAGEFSDNG